MIHALQRLKAPLLLTLFVAVTALAYFPGLEGSFLYDDITSISENPSVKIASGSLAEWTRAAISFPSGTPPFRSLTMLTFAGNHLSGGLDPFGYKLINLLVHLLNGCLLYLVLRALFTLRSAVIESKGLAWRPFDSGLAAAVLAGLWMLLPINLTAVLYVVQRLESLSTTFIFLGLFWYLRARLHTWQAGGIGVGLWLSIGVCTLLGVLCKETGAMLPLYAFLVEICLVGARARDGRLNRSIVLLFVTTLLLPLAIGAVWLWSRFLGPGILEPGSSAVIRLITEARVICDYIVWILFPFTDSLSLYHDDFLPSTGLFSPVSTVLSIIALCTLFLAAVWQRRARPLFALGIFWFFAGHLLTGTVIPLVLAFEHRNYFSSSALILAVASVVTLERGPVRIKFRLALSVLAGTLYASILWMRAQEWSDPSLLASSEAKRQPQSPAAQFNYAQFLIKAARETGQGEPLNAAFQLLNSSRKLPGASTHFEQTMITLLAKSGHAIPDDLWTSVIGKLERNPPDINAIRSLSRLNHCFMDKFCRKTDLPRLSQAYSAAMSHPVFNTELLNVHGEYGWHVLDNQDVTERDYREVVRRNPRDVDADVNLIVVLIYRDKFAEAESMIESLEKRNFLGTLDSYVRPLRLTLESRRGRSPSGTEAKHPEPAS